MKFKLTCVALSALLLGSCAKDTLVEVPTKSESVSLLLSATSAGTVTITKTDPPALPTGISTGVYVSSQGITDKYVHTNKNFVSDGTGALKTATGIDPLSLTVGSNYDIYAYAPFKTSVDNPNAIAVSLGDDVLWTPKASIISVSKDNCTAALAFQHRGAQISFEVRFASDFTAGSKEITSSSTIEVSGFYTDGVLHLPSGTITPYTTKITTLSDSGKGAPGSMTLGIPMTNFLAPTDKLSLPVKVTHEGKTYTGAINTTFAAGTSNVYTITISGRSPDLAVTGTLAPWTVVNSDLTVTESN